MKAAVIDKPVAPARACDGERLREIVLLRIAAAIRGVTRAELAADLAPLVAPGLSAAQWRPRCEQEIDTLVAAGLAASSGARAAVTDAGSARAAAFLGLGKGPLPRLWADLRDTRLVAKALGLHRKPGKHIKALSTNEGLRAAIVQRTFKLKIKGVATSSRLRAALAGVALDRAFGNQVTAGLASGKSGLSAKAGRLLAAQLCRKPRDFGTDARLIAALAAEHMGTAHADLGTLRLAVLRRFIEGDDKPAPVKPQTAAAAPVPRRPEPAAVAMPAPLAAGRPDLAGFASEVRRHAGARAEGWPGNRKAYISHVWRLVRERRPEWGLSEIEFKCMLAEAHRVGELALSNADLKDSRNIQDLKDSAITYQNAVFHFIRADG